MGLFVLARCAVFASLMAAASLLHAQALVVPPEPMSRDDLLTVYTELTQTHDGFMYSLHLLRYTTEEAARKVWDQLQEPRFRAQRFERIFKSSTPRNFYFFALEPSMRERVVGLLEGRRTGVVKGTSAWFIAELVSTKPTPMPTFEAAAPNIPALVADGRLPTAEQLRTDPALRKRSAANAIQSVEQLAAAPSDLDVNMRLSNLDTLLNRTLLQKKLALADALLKRGANPNLCARGFCPLQLAVYGNSPDALELLLKAGADVNQKDPLDGETPLMAAASTGNRAMAETLLARGADPFIVSTTAPARSALHMAERARQADPAFAAWLRGEMRARAKASGQYAWDGWIEQDGRRHAIDAKPVLLKRAPFRVIARMKPDRMLYVSAGTDARLFEEFRKGDPGNAMFSTLNLSFESKTSDTLVVHEPQPPGARWGGSEAWWKDDKDSRFTKVTDTPQGREHAREIRTLIVIDAKGNVGDDVPVSAYRGGSIYLVLGTRIHMTVADDEVFAPRTVELKFQ